jgi:hypothetical protein
LPRETVRKFRRGPKLRLREAVKRDEEALFLPSGTTKTYSLEALQLFFRQFLEGVFSETQLLAYPVLGTRRGAPVQG